MRCGRLIVTTSLALATALASGCGVKTTTVDVSDLTETQSSEPKLYVQDLQEACDLAIEDLDRFPLDSKLLEYVEYASKSSHMIYDSDATQKDIDKAVKKLKKMRKRIVDPLIDEPAYGIDEPMPSYSDVVNDYEQYVGKVFFISGHVNRLHVPGVGTKDTSDDGDCLARVQWNNSDIEGEVVVIRVERVRYESIHAYFEGRCLMEGITEEGRPQMLSYSYES